MINWDVSNWEPLKFVPVKLLKENLENLGAQSDFHPIAEVSKEKMLEHVDLFWIKRRIRSGRLLRIFTVAFLLFLAPSGSSKVQLKSRALSVTKL